MEKRRDLREKEKRILVEKRRKVGGKESETRPTCSMPNEYFAINGAIIGCIFDGFPRVTGSWCNGGWNLARYGRRSIFLFAYNSFRYVVIIGSIRCQSSLATVRY